MANNKVLKLKLFECGLKALSTATGTKIDVYHCPICTNEFTKEDLSNRLLTLEHIPPEAQGGKGIALTCKKCNNTAGHTVDAAVFTRNHLEGIKTLLSKQGSFKTRVRVDFGHENLKSVNYDLCIKDGAVRFYPVKGANRPDCADNIKDLIQQTNIIPNEERSAWNITTRKSYNTWYAKIGDLRSAFLVCFALFGYRYAFAAELEAVRHQILNYHTKFLDYFFISTESDFAANFSLGIVTSPFSAIFCQLQNYGIFLPWKDSPKDFYEYLKVSNQTLTNQTFSFTPISWPKSLEAKLDYLGNKY
jgi:hypothetical protein